MEDFVTFEQAKKLKELGFDWETFAFYLGTALNTKVPSWQIINTTDLSIISAPTLAQVQKWLRTKDIHIEIVFEKVYKDKQLCDIWLTTIDKMTLYEVETLKERFHTYEEALSAGIDKALELLK